MTRSDKNMWARRDILRLSGGVGTGLLLAGCLESGDDDGSGDSNNSSDSGSGGGNNAISIGLVTPQTGTLAPYGQRNQRGKKLALNAINDVGIGSNGRTLDVLVEDSESKNQSGVNAARKLVNQNQVPLLVGAVGSGVSLAIYNSVTSGADVVQISQNSTSPELSKKSDLFRMSPSGAAKWKALAKLLKRDGKSKVAATWINNDYGQGFADTFPNVFDGEVAYINPHDQDQSSYRGVLSEMANTDANAWLFITYANEYTIMVNEAFDQGYNEQADYYGAESTVADSIIKNTSDGSQTGMQGITESAPTDQQSYKQFKTEFQKQFDKTPTVWSAYAYDAVTVAAIAAEAADEMTGSALQKVIRDVTRPKGTKVFNFEEAKNILADGGSATDINYEGVSGPVDLDKNGDPPGFYQIYRVKNHSYEYGDFITG
ncbi:ABC transporter substrate-binding protein [Halocatena marina]|uniref:ABC transporter substrate-binding protein n=1 Tax=Halocatena marina TaxID=2934937 RepID=A0ABD5YQE1_9EURY|nr:ABC transporter substrate-binding protein [Halocatena marina]